MGLFQVFYFYFLFLTENSCLLLKRAVAVNQNSKSCGPNTSFQNVRNVLITAGSKQTYSVRKGKKGATPEFVYSAPQQQRIHLYMGLDKKAKATVTEM